MASTTFTGAAHAVSARGRLEALRLYRWELLLGAAVVFLFLFLAWRNHGLSPYVFADELSYSTFSRLIPLAESVVPSYLYLWLFSASNACGSGFLECVRFGNELLFLASAPFIYLTARQVCPRPAAVTVTLAALAGPVNSYTAFFMPESTYFFGFSVLAWASLRSGARDWVALGLAGGAILGLMALVKVHALFLVPAQCAFAFAAMYLGGGPWLRRGAGAAALTVAAMLAVRFGVGYLLAGAPGLHLFGPLYGNHADGHSGQLASYLPFVWDNLQGHLMGLALMFTFPLALMGYALVNRSARREQSAELTALQLYAVLALGASLGMAVLYTASLYGLESMRVHSRYYNFTFPLLFMVAAAGLQRSSMARARLPATVLALAGAAALAYAAHHFGSDFRLLISDGPEAGTLVENQRYLYLLAAIQVLVLGAWLIRARLASLLYLGLFLPCFVLLTGVAVNDLMASLRTPSAWDQAGKFARGYLAPAELAQLTITGASAGELMRIKFHLDAPQAKIMVMPDGAPPDVSQARTKWLLLVGTHPIPPQLKVRAGAFGYNLIRMDNPVRELGRIDLTSAHPELGMLAAAEGLSVPEPWGRWSDGKVVRLRLAKALPRELIVTLSVRAFGPNAGRDFIFRAGQQEHRFQAEETESKRAFRFDTDGALQELVIIVPQPAPSIVDGKVVDARQMGLGLSEIRIATPSNE